MKEKDLTSLYREKTLIRASSDIPIQKDKKEKFEDQGSKPPFAQRSSNKSSYVTDQTRELKHARNPTYDRVSIKQETSRKVEIRQALPHKEKSH